MQHSTYKRHASYGPGGRNCPCCGPAPSERKAADRRDKRRERIAAKREIHQEVELARYEGELA